MTSIKDVFMNQREREFIYEEKKKKIYRTLNLLDETNKRIPKNEAKQKKKK